MIALLAAATVSRFQLIVYVAQQAGLNLFSDSNHKDFSRDVVHTGSQGHYMEFGALYIYAFYFLYILLHPIWANV